MAREEAGRPGLPDRGADHGAPVALPPSSPVAGLRRGGRVLRMGRAIREQVQAATGIGLSTPGTRRLQPRRATRPGCGAEPPISFLSAGGPGGRRVVFIHGTPGDASDWLPLLANAPDGQERIAIDRPGFGRSGPGRPVVSLAEQAHAVATLLGTGAEPAVVVGSSYGGPVALRLAADEPERVAGVLLVGAAADPAREHIHPLQRLGATKIVAGLLPRALAHANAELIALRDELKALEQRLARIRAPVTILQGMRDTLVPPENAAYLVERLTGSIARRAMLVENAGHFLHILRPEIVETALERLLAEPQTP
ncbi:alpha/beta fold hydrolase [Acuticoccus sediminis]|nr:alpha/beta hydrolase [Acuticoccus sediminis]